MCCRGLLLLRPLLRPSCAPLAPPCAPLAPLLRPSCAPLAPSSRPLRRCCVPLAERHGNGARRLSVSHLDLDRSLDAVAFPPVSRTAPLSVLSRPPLFPPFPFASCSRPSPCSHLPTAPQTDPSPPPQRPGVGARGVCAAALPHRQPCRGVGHDAGRRARARKGAGRARVRRALAAHPAVPVGGRRPSQPASLSLWLSKLF
jgi:hypothetical protein